VKEGSKKPFYTDVLMAALVSVQTVDTTDQATYIGVPFTP